MFIGALYVGFKGKKKPILFLGNNRWFAVCLLWIYFTHSNYNNDANIYTFALWRMTYVTSQTKNTSPPQSQNVHLCLRIILKKQTNKQTKEKGKDAMTHYMRSQRKKIR